MQFFDTWATLVSQLLGGLSSHPVLLESPKRPGFSLTTAVREQHLSSAIAAAHKPPIFLTELPFAVQDCINNVFQSYQLSAIIKTMS